MATNTTNYNLIKPALTDPADITQMNTNWDKVDTELKTLDDGKLPSNGGTMSGTIEFKKVENGYGRLAKNHGSSADYGMYLTDVDIDGKTFKLIVSGKDNNIYVVPNDNSGQYKLFGEHNKQLMRDNIFEYGTTDLVAGTSAMTTGKLYFVYE